LSFVKACISDFLQHSDVSKTTGYGSRRSHGRANQMGARTLALAPTKVSVAGGRRALPWGQRVTVDANAHGTTRQAPFEAGCKKNLIETFGFRLCFDQP
jgi:hypothetical protein